MVLTHTPPMSNRQTSGLFLLDGIFNVSPKRVYVLLSLLHSFACSILCQWGGYHDISLPSAIECDVLTVVLRVRAQRQEGYLGQQPHWLQILFGQLHAGL